ncbi:MAG TPA: bifunctional acetate--CoA ligase family protein/GNAT family N-acetyltransferase [Bryobacteraceae bacterium]|nr:bifunctional acetate--CoA ligase family protein/GNAT family N-acetyltransferase [Bryobacteraceae bacterium]
MGSQRDAPKRRSTLTRTSLDTFFRPSSVALIGASERPGSVGRVVLENLRSATPQHPVYAVNPTRESVLGRPAYKTVADAPGPVDLAVITTPAPTVPGVVRECAEAGVRGAIVISAGFRETGEEGRKLEACVLAEARGGNMRIIGPNCLGVMSPLSGLNATFAGSMAARGSVAFLSQSGALCTAMLDWSEREVVGFSAFVSLGSMVDVSWGDLIGYLGDDPHTRSIVLYMETIGDARSFLSAAREVSLSKPIIVIKAGRTPGAAKAAASHTGSLAGSDEVLDAAFRRVGVLRVNNVSDIFYMVETLAKQPRPQGPRLTIVTNAGGPGVLATDSLIASGGQLAELSPSLSAELDALLPPHWSHGNPVDVLGDADAATYAKAIDTVTRNPESDGLLVIMTPQGTTSPTGIAQSLRQYARTTGKPILASWMGGQTVAEGARLLTRAGIPVFPYPDTAARAFTYLWQYTYHLRALYETPALTSDEHLDDAKYAAEQVIDSARTSGRTILDEAESKKILDLYGIPTVQTVVALSETEAVAAAAHIGYPVVLKLYSKTITHKTDVGGVKLNLHDEAAVRVAFHSIRESLIGCGRLSDFDGVTVQPMISLRDGYELILGSSTDAQFGPVLLFGSGGQLVEILKDRSLGLPPLNTTLARRMMERTKIWTALQGIRGRAPVNVAALEELLVRFSRLVIEQRWIQEIDINPLFATHSGFVALDARMVVYNKDTREENLPKLAIRPYPVHYVKYWLTRDNVAVTIRPIRPEDEHRMVNFHQRLSERTVYQRYFHHMKLQQRVAHDRLARICFVDYDRQIVLVAERINAESGEREIVAVARLARLLDPQAGEFAVLVADEFQRQGLGTELTRTLLDIGRQEQISTVRAEILAENAGMLSLCRTLGFKPELKLEDATVEVEVEL